MDEVNIGRALLHMFPHADPMSDYMVMADENKQWIEHWYLDEPEPTEEQIREAYWEALEEDEKRASEPTQAEIIENLLKENEDLKEKIKQSEDNNLIALNAIAELYEMMLRG